MEECDGRDEVCEGKGGVELGRGEVCGGKGGVWWEG